MLDGESKTYLPPGLGKRLQDFWSYGLSLQSENSIFGQISIGVSPRVREGVKWARVGRGCELLVNFTVFIRWIR